MGSNLMDNQVRNQYKINVMVRLKVDLVLMYGGHQIDLIAKATKLFIKLWLQNVPIWFCMVLLI